MEKSMEEFCQQVMSNKKYSLFPEEFVIEILKKNLGKRDPVKETRNFLRMNSLMYSPEERGEKNLCEIFSFITEKTGLTEVSVLDLGCGMMREFPKCVKSYTGVDIYPFSENIIQDDVRAPKKDWACRHYDVCLMLNLIPLLEKTGGSSGVLGLAKKISDFVVVSFPRYSISGKKWIGDYWEKWAEKNLKGLHKKIIGTELVIILQNL
jgi:hypothetical protein